jgi:hypothetical protein
MLLVYHSQHLHVSYITVTQTSAAGGYKSLENAFSFIFTMKIKYVYFSHKQEMYLYPTLYLK